VDQKANQLAYHVVATGVSPGATVALLMRRTTPDFIVSLLAVLKAGCAYSALPAELPEQALSLLLQNTAPALVITHAGLHASLPKGPDAPRVFNYDAAPDAEALSKR
jgi:non-ribosomal peptide synthetase component F